MTTVTNIQKPNERKPKLTGSLWISAVALFFPLPAEAALGALLITFVNSPVKALRSAHISSPSLCSLILLPVGATAGDVIHSTDRSGQNGKEYNSFSTKLVTLWVCTNRSHQSLLNKKTLTKIKIEKQNHQNRIK
jgi:hypothetical protein